MKMNKDDANRIVKAVETMYRNSENLSQKLCSELMDKSFILNMFGGDESERKRGENMLEALVHRVYENLMDSYNDQYGIVCSMGNLERSIIEKEEITNMFLEETKYIDIASSDDSLYVKLPRVPVKYYKRTNLFVEQIRDKMWELKLKNAVPEIPDKLVRVLNVFSTSFEERRIPDNDNYDTKAIVDTLTDFIGGGDFGLTCSFYRDALKSDEVCEGTYIIISKSENGIMSADDVLHVLKRVFEGVNRRGIGK